MKKAYDELGKESLKRLRANTANANQIQRELLFSLLEKNKDTAYGKKHHFAEIHSLQAYQKLVPLTDYGDYDAYIQEMLEGTEAVLTAQAPAYYCISSGSTGEPKYLPASQADMDVYFWYVYGAVFGMVREYYSELLPEHIFGTIFQIGEFVKTHTDRGVMNGIRSSSLYQWMDRFDDFDASDYCVPKEVLFPKDLEDLIYVKVRFALADPEITAIHGVFLHRVVGVFSYIEKHWDLLLKDMESGTVDERIPLSRGWREKVQRWLPPNPARAQELRRLSPETLADHMVQKIWKNMRYIMAVGGRTMERYAEQYARYAAGIPTHHFGYGASEGVIGVANGVEQPDANILLPNAGFFEFLPQDDSACQAEARPLFCNEIRVGGTYELVYTNLSGLYRYRMKDVLRIEGFYGESPIVSFCYRKNQVLNISDEKTNTEQLECAIRELEQKAGLCISGYCIQEDHSRSPGCYLCYLECIGRGGEAAEKEFDLCLCRANYSYEGCRNFGELGHAKLAYLKQGAFTRYKELLAGKGYEMGQNKPVRVLSDGESRHFFLMEIEEPGKGEEDLCENAE